MNLDSIIDNIIENVDISFGNIKVSTGNTYLFTKNHIIDLIRNKFYY